MTLIMNLGLASSHGEGHGVSSSPGAGNEFVNGGDNYIDESRASPRESPVCRALWELSMQFIMRKT